MKSCVKLGNNKKKLSMEMKRDAFSIIPKANKVKTIS